MNGSLINTVLGSATKGQPTPEIGMGATMLYYSDRHACTIVRIVNERRIGVQCDTATRIDNNGMSERQTYSYEPNKTARIEYFTLRKNGAWVRQGEDMSDGLRLRIGERNEYHDFSF